MKYFVTGGASFIGSKLTSRMFADDHTVVGFDNFSSGQQEFNAIALSLSVFTLVHADPLSLPTLDDTMKSMDLVFPLDTNTDVRFGPEHPRKDLEQNTIETFNVLKARQTGILV